MVEIPMEVAVSQAEIPMDLGAGFALHHYASKSFAGAGSRRKTFSYENYGFVPKRLVVMSTSKITGITKSTVISFVWTGSGSTVTIRFLQYSGGKITGTASRTGTIQVDTENKEITIDTGIDSVVFASGSSGGYGVHAFD